MSKKAKIFVPTQNDIDYVKQHWSPNINSTKKREILAHLGITPDQLRMIRKKHLPYLSPEDIRKMRTRTFSEEDVAYIKANLFKADGVKKANEVAVKFNLTGITLLALLKQHNIVRNKRPKPPKVYKRKPPEVGDKKVVRRGNVQYEKEYNGDKWVTSKRLTPMFKLGVPKKERVIGEERIVSSRDRKYKQVYIGDGIWQSIGRVGEIKPKQPREPKPPKPPKPKQEFPIGYERTIRSEWRKYRQQYVGNGKWKTVEKYHTPKSKYKPPYLPAGTKRVKTNANGIQRLYETDGSGNWKMIERLSPYKVRAVKEPKEIKPKPEPKPRLKMRDYKEPKPKAKKTVTSRIIESKDYIKPRQVKPDPQSMKIPQDNKVTHRYITVYPGTVVFASKDKSDEQVIAEYAAKKEQAMLDIKNQGKKQKKTA